jgi:hypothetical protein
VLRAEYERVGLQNSGAAEHDGHAMRACSPFDEANRTRTHELLHWDAGVDECERSRVDGGGLRATIVADNLNTTHDAA